MYSQGLQHQSGDMRKFNSKEGKGFKRVKMIQLQVFLREMDTCERKERRYVASNVFTRKPRQRETNVLISQRFITASIIFYHVLDTVYLHYYTTQLASFWLLDATCDGKREREREKKKGRGGEKEAKREREREREGTHTRTQTYVFPSPKNAAVQQ